MARYEHLPVYKAALDVAVGFEKLVAGFSRYHKYTLGMELRNGGRRVVERVVLAKGARHVFPLRQLPRRLNGLLAHGHSVVFVTETGTDPGRLRERSVRWRFVAGGQQWARRRGEKDLHPQSNGSLRVMAPD